MAERDKDGQVTMIFRLDRRAWMLAGPACMKSPKAITEPHGDGRSPVKSFASVRSRAARKQRNLLLTRPERPALLGGLMVLCSSRLFKTKESE